MKTFVTTFTLHTKSGPAAPWVFNDTYTDLDDALDMASEIKGEDFTIVETGPDLHTTDITETAVATRNTLLAARGAGPIFATSDERDDYESGCDREAGEWARHCTIARRRYERGAL